MTSHPPEHPPSASSFRWGLLPSHSLERLVRVTLFLFACEAGVLWRFAAVGAGPDGIVSIALFSPLILAAAIILATIGASGLFRLTRTAGWHGVIRLDSNRVSLDGKAAFDLNTTLSIDGWQATAQIRQQLRLPYLDRYYPVPHSAEAPARWTWAAVVNLAQAGRTASVCASLPAGRNPSPGPAGLQLPVDQPRRPAKPCVRLTPEDLVELVAVVRENLHRPLPADAGATPRATAPDDGPDPRSMLHSQARVLGVSIALVLLAAIPPAIQILRFSPAPIDAASVESAEVARQMRMLRARNSLERRIATRELGILGRKAAPALETLRTVASQDPDPGVRDAAAEAVESIRRSMEQP